MDMEDPDDIMEVEPFRLHMPDMLRRIINASPVLTRQLLILADISLLQFSAL